MNSELHDRHVTMFGIFSFNIYYNFLCQIQLDLKTIYEFLIRASKMGNANIRSDGQYRRDCNVCFNFLVAALYRRYNRSLASVSH